YVISNLGSMGERVVKIGMTRRLDPLDRIRELSDASVPFNFDVHALFFSEDAYGIEAMLHRHFADRRVNRINLRREFFYATPAEVLDALREHRIAVVEYRTEAEADEYRASQALAAERA
ncbi:MAG TPA: GIY-YIG nuclease family protein, partial [Coriobacteriia bacterium]|nr:GIY-YIG nuclease family protein [Coriobacteriia bacterium]